MRDPWFPFVIVPLQFLAIKHQLPLANPFLVYQYQLLVCPATGMFSSWRGAVYPSVLEAPTVSLCLFACSPSGLFCPDAATSAAQVLALRRDRQRSAPWDAHGPLTAAISPSWGLIGWTGLCSGPLPGLLPIQPHRGFQVHAFLSPLTRENPVMCLSHFASPWLLAIFPGRDLNRDEE